MFGSLEKELWQPPLELQTCEKSSYKVGTLILKLEFQPLLAALDIALKFGDLAFVSPRGCLGSEQRIPKGPKLLSMSLPSEEWLRDLVLQVSHSEITHAGHFPRDDTSNS
ncbi:hypothetical protein LguiB_009394 [Lonicera macranthoides]